ncbi:hypothetical protein [Trichlorobacter lovleyi]|uniref:hypothetical protein n=1 Tax=Trichlorobacter lovleyi TaxID=313985 RepID=UPI003D13C63A
MSLGLAKNNAPEYDYYSSSDGSDPVSASALLNNSGGTVNSGTVTAYLIATTFRYTGITVGLSGEQAGIDWKLSLDNSTWADSVNPSDMNALVSDVAIPIYIRAVVNNNGTVNTGLYSAPNITFTSTEEPS